MSERNPRTGDPTDPLVGRVAAIIAGDDHPAWLSMPQERRNWYYGKAEEIIALVQKSLGGPTPADCKPGGRDVVAAS